MAKVDQIIETSKYKFVSCSKNPEFLPGKLIPFIPCQEYNKASKNIITGTPVYDHIGFVEDVPKWITRLRRLDGFEYSTNNLKSANARKIKACERLFNYYEPLYQKRIVSILILTFTRMNYARLKIKPMLECVKARLKSLKWVLRGFMWVLEIKPNDKIEGGFHLHYHLVIVVDRVRIEKLPKQL